MRAEKREHPCCVIINYNRLIGYGLVCSEGRFYKDSWNEEVGEAEGVVDYVGAGVERAQKGYPEGGQVRFERISREELVRLKLKVLGVI